MSAIFGALGVNDTDRVFISTLGQPIVWDAVQAFLEQHNADLQAAYGVFVETETEDFKERYKLPGGGYLQPRGVQARPANVKAIGSWDTAYPLSDFGADLAWNDVDFAYMTVQELTRHLLTIQQQDINTMRRSILVSMLDDGGGSPISFADPLHGTLSVQPLANGDATVYPPVLGSDSEATENHYLESGYAASAISDANDPFVTLVDELEEHFGAPTGGSNIVVFHNNAQTAKVQALTAFDPVNDRFVIPGANVTLPDGLPMALPGKIIGRHEKGAWAVEWRQLPANYMVAIHMDAIKPLKLRKDPADTGLGTGLQLIAKDEDKPFTDSFYRHRYGFGVGNRLNGVSFELGTGGTYTIPTGYSH